MWCELYARKGKALREIASIEGESSDMGGGHRSCPTAQLEENQLQSVLALSLSAGLVLMVLAACFCASRQGNVHMPQLEQSYHLPKQQMWLYISLSAHMLWS